VGKQQSLRNDEELVLACTSKRNQLIELHDHSPQNRREKAVENFSEHFTA